MLGKNLINAAAGSAGGDYQISRSLRFNSADTAYLTRTPASAGNRKTWTWSAWVKRGQINATYQTFLEVYNGANNLQTFNIGWYNGEQIGIGAYSILWKVTSAVFRDPSSWYHIVLVLDTTNATADDRIKLYVNGERITSFTTSNNPSLNDDLAINQAAAHYLGSGNARSYLNGYLAEVHFVDGQALDQLSFGEINATTGVWSPIAYAGTYGTNGFYLDFSDNSSTTALGTDSSGNGNNWTPNNFSVTAGAGNDSLVDSPTQYGTDTGAGGEVRGNYCVINPLDSGSSSNVTANGNLDLTLTNASSIRGSFYVSTGKWYYEVSVTTLNNLYLGLASNGGRAAGYTSTSAFGVNNAGDFYEDNTLQTEDSIALAAGSVYGIAFDADAKKFWISKDGQWYSCDRTPDITINASDVESGLYGYDFSTLSGDVYAPHFGNSTTAGAKVSANFGQRPFAYTAPSGFKALCTTNLPDPTVVQGDDYFNTVLYSGNGATQSITGVGFQPDFVWYKSRVSGVYNHGLFDAVRGATKFIASNSTAAEITVSGVSSFDSDGFTLGGDLGGNASGAAMVAWNWNAGGSNATNTDGTITSTVRANPTAGFSIVSYTGTGTTSSVGHGLGTTPAMVIVKSRTSAVGWPLWHQGLGGTDKVITLNTTGAVQTISGYWGAAINSTVFGLISGAYDNNRSGDSYIAYCFAEIPGFSAFGKYTGNGSADGPFVYTGFKPAWVMIKLSSDVSHWNIVDVKRDAYNVMNKTLQASSTSAEISTYTLIDALSNGFKVRQSLAFINQNGGTFIYAAFAENPFKYSLGR